MKKELWVTAFMVSDRFRLFSIFFFVSQRTHCRPFFLYLLKPETVVSSSSLRSNTTAQTLVFF